MRLRTPLLLLLACCLGCSILNAPDRSKLQSDGGGMDADMDAGPDADAGMPDGDAGPDDGGGDDDEVCDNGEDDDGDGLRDCADFDCADAPVCCTERQENDLIKEEWNVGLEGRWRAVPVDEDVTFPQRDDGQLTGFDRSDIPNGIVRTSCSPLELGAQLKVTLTAGGSDACSEDECDRYAGVVLSGAQNMAPGRHLVDDLGVFLEANGRLIVTQARSECRGDPACEEKSIIGRWDDENTGSRIAVGKTVDLTVDVTPGTDRGRAFLFATVEATPRGQDEQTLLERYPFVQQDNLVRDSGNCSDIRGLYVAVEGRGSGVDVGRLLLGSWDCSNPGHFDRAGDAIVDRAELGLTGSSWAEWGFGGPALVGSCAVPSCWESGESRWDLLFEATNADTTLASRVGFALGHVFSGDSWNTWTGNPDGDPKTGDDPPTCLAEPCPADLVSVRDPGALALRDPADGMLREDGDQETGFLVAYARQQEEDNPFAEKFDLRVRRADCMDHSLSSPQCTFAPDAATSIGSDVFDECTSLRHPELIPLRPGDPPEYWLLFACERDDAPQDIRFIRLGSALGVDRTKKGTLLAPEMLSSVDAGQGVTEPEAVVDFGKDADQVMLRLWFRASGVAGSNIGLVAASIPRETFEDTLVPADGAGDPFEEYGANPVLPADGTVLGNCPGDCDYWGFDVALHGDQRPNASRDSPRELRFLLARSVNDTEGFRHEVVPLDQVWRVDPPVMSE